MLELETERTSVRDVIQTPEQMVNYINNYTLNKDVLQNNNLRELSKEELINYLNEYERLEKEVNKNNKGLSLIQFLSKNGGIFDEKSDIGAFKDIREQAPFLLRKDKTNDNTIDNQFKKAVEAGYFSEIEDYRDINNSVNTLIEAIQDELKGNKRYSNKDIDKRTKIDEFENFKNYLDEAGISIDDLKMLRELDNKNNFNDVNNINNNNVDSNIDINKEIETFYQNNPEIESKIDEVIKLYKTKEDKRIELGKVSKELSDILKQNNIDVENYKHDIDTKEIRHLLKGHGENGKKLTKNSIPITDNDIRQIPYIIDNYDYIELGHKNIKGLDNIRYVKVLQDGTTYYVEEIRTGKKTLSAITMWKEKSRSTAHQKMSRITANPTSTIKIIQNPNKNVNKNYEVLNQEEKFNNKIDKLESYIEGNIDNQELKDFDNKLIEDYEIRDNLTRDNIRTILAKKVLEQKLKDFAKINYVKDFHKNQNLEFKSKPEADIKVQEHFYFSHEMAKRQSTYSLALDKKGNLYYVREADHWGEFITKINDIEEQRQAIDKLFFFKLLYFTVIIYNQLLFAILNLYIF